MSDRNALSTQEVAEMLNVSKSTIYDMIRKGEIKSYKVGRKVRFTEDDVKEYIETSKKTQSSAYSSNVPGGFQMMPERKSEGFVLCGQDVILDVLSNYMRLHGIPALRAYIGSYDSLISLYRKQINVATSHLWDSDSDTYNIPYVRRLLPGIPTLVINLAWRMQGLYVLKGNPKNITSWKDFGRKDITMVNREYGAGSRVLLDENLKLLGIYGNDINGYNKEIQSHLAVASAVSSGKADVAVGNEKIAKQVDGIEFIPMKKERYDLVFRKEDLLTPEIQTMLNIIRSEAFQSEFDAIGGYDTSEMGKIVAEI
jgi:putative molybdopterin biosynthesis protein